MKRAVTRRDFVKSSSVLAAGGFTLPAFARRVHMSHADTLRIGLVGCGGRGTGAAMQALNADENNLLTCVGDVFADRAESALGNLRADAGLAQRIQINDGAIYSGFDNYKEVIDSDVDVVLLCTPPVFRPMHLAYAIEKGKHVFCEKPMGVDAPGVRSVIESAKKAKEKHLALVSGFCWRYSAAQREAYQRIHDGAIGEVRSVQTTYNTGPLGDVARNPEWTDMEWQLRNWKAFNWASGDHIVEQACHAIDWMNWAFNGRMPARAFAVGGRAARSGEWTGNMYDHFGVFYEYEDGSRGYHMCRQIEGCSNDNTAHLIGTKGAMKSDPWGPSIEITGENPWRFRGSSNDMYQQEHDDMFASIRRGEPINDGEWMANSTLLAILGRECAYTGKTIAWDEMLNSQKRYGPTEWAWGELEFPPVPVPGKTE
jgi:predicted dehydrogenase